MQTPPSISHHTSLNSPSIYPNCPEMRSFRSFRNSHIPIALHARTQSPRICAPRPPNRPLASNRPCAQKRGFRSQEAPRLSGKRNSRAKSSSSLYNAELSVMVPTKRFNPIRRLAPTRHSYLCRRGVRTRADATFTPAPTWNSRRPISNSHRPLRRNRVHRSHAIPPFHKQRRKIR